MTLFFNFGKSSFKKDKKICHSEEFSINDFKDLFLHFCLPKLQKYRKIYQPT